MTTGALVKRGLFWPIAFGLFGVLTLVDYFYKSSFQSDDLLKGLGFLFMVPLAYFHPSAYSSRPDSVLAGPATWTKWLSFVGLALVIIGCASRWL